MLLAGAGVTLGRRWRSRRTLDRIGGRPLVAGTPSFRVNGRRAVRTGGLSTSLSRDARSVHGRSFSAGCGQPVRVSSVPHPGKTETRLAASCAHFAEEKRLFFIIIISSAVSLLGEPLPWIISRRRRAEGKETRGNLCFSFFVSSWKEEQNRLSID